ncbi:hypothetical protein N8T08_006918 [Aspergillus melleus]|uniref:Uncharacterized protein n=1 Tax=Aspergillus melleus TaxID=138277 RepID=A0ACC3B0G7_9EURO|nr:hypothetical protein N8T08_006918 [Aspergillus melleus]
MSGTVHTVVSMNGQQGYSTDEDVGKDQDIYLEVSSDATLQLNDNTESSYKVILQFQNAQDTDWSVKTPSSSDPLNDSLKDLVQALMSKEEFKGFTFTLGTVKNTKDQNSDFLQLQKFRFNATEGVLSIFIQVKGGSGK